MSLTNDKNFMKQLDIDIEKLSKSLYLDSPDLWVDFLDRSNDKKFDEMSLFFATKNDMISILRYSVEENGFDLNSPSKNKGFSSVKDSLLDVAIKEDSSQVLAYLSGEEVCCDNSTNANIDIEYICPNCKSNVFKSGYNVLISSTCTYSTLDKKIIRSTPKELDSVICSNCNFELKEVTPSKLENLTNVENCTNCGSILPKVGIVKEVNVNYDSKTHAFTEGNSSYCCKSCRKSLDSNQLSHFNLI